MVDLAGVAALGGRGGCGGSLERTRLPRYSLIMGNLQGIPQILLVLSSFVSTITPAAQRVLETIAYPLEQGIGARLAATALDDQGNLRWGTSNFRRTRFLAPETGALSYRPRSSLALSARSMPLPCVAAKVCLILGVITNPASMCRAARSNLNHILFAGYSPAFTREMGKSSAKSQVGPSFPPLRLASCRF